MRSSLLIFFICAAACWWSPTSLLAQDIDKTLDIMVEAYQGKDRVKEVDYTLSLNSKEVIKVTSKKGSFNFVIKPNDGVYELKMEKEGFLTKKVLFDSYSYPFNNAYELQEIILECIPVGAKLNEAVYAGTMKYDPVANAFRVTKSDTIRARLSEEVKNNTKQLNDIYEKAVYNGDGLRQIEEYEYAKGYFEIALLAKPDDEYASSQLALVDSLAEVERNKPRSILVAKAEIPQQQTEEETSASNVEETEPASKATQSTPVAPVKTNKPLEAPAGTYFSVQLGAFVDWFDQDVFKDVPDFIVAQGADYKRCLSGKFATREEATDRMNLMRENGFKDAFVVTMKENERIGF